MGWTEDRVELLTKLWLEGLSASQISTALGDGVTRNAVIGKVHRLKLTGRAKPASATQRPRAAPRGPARRVSGPTVSRSAGGAPVLGMSLKARNMGVAPIQGATALKISEEFVVEALVAAPVQELFIPESERLSLLDLSEHTCKWPIGDPLTPDFYFCGQHSEDGKPYCEFHARRAFHQLDRRKR